MNAFYRALSAMVNWIVDASRYLTGWIEGAGYVEPLLRVGEAAEPWIPSDHHLNADEVAAAAWSFPATSLRLSERADVPLTYVAAQALRAPVSLRKTVSLVRPFVAPLSARPAQAVGRVAASALQAGRAIQAAMDTRRSLRPTPSIFDVDELGLPRTPMARSDAPTAGIFEQARDAWLMHLARTGRSNDLSWA